MNIVSNLPPVSFQSVVDGQWYLVTTGREGKWTKVDRKYEWSEIEPLWVRQEFKKVEKSVVILPKKVKKQTFSVAGSKGNVYEVISDSGRWTCSCPAHGFGRGRDCKHITELKNKI
jgi:hypothetical protein